IQISQTSDINALGLTQFYMFFLFFLKYSNNLPYYKKESSYKSICPAKKTVLQKAKVSIGLFFKQSSYRKESVLQNKFRSTKSKKVSTGRGVFSFLSNRLTEEHLSYKKKFHSTKGKR